MTTLEIKNNIFNYDDGDKGCRICNTYWADEEITLEHINSQQHMENIQEIEDLIQGEFMELPDGRHGRRVRCTLCQCFVGFLYEPIATHCAGSGHKLARVIAIKPLNGICSVKDNNDSVWCKLCSEYLDNTVDDIIAHIDDDPEHGRCIELIEKYEYDFDFTDYLASYQGQPQCSQCAVPVPVSFSNDLDYLDDLHTHLRGRRHRAERAIALKPLNGIFPVTGNDSVWCKLCPEYIDNYVDDILEHIDDDAEHQRCINLIEQYENDYIDFTDYLTTLSSGRVWCKKCQVNVPCTIDNDFDDIGVHCKGARHSK